MFDKLFGLKGISLGFLFVFTTIFTVATYGAGEIDTNFNPIITKDVISNYTGSSAVQPDGKILLFGSFSGGSGYLIRINPDGTPDTSFNCGVCSSGFTPGSLIVQPDGKILLNGIRLNADGSQDNTFNISFTSPVGGAGATVHALQPDGKVIIRFTYSLMGRTGHQIRRYNTDGTDDNSFTPIVFPLQTQGRSFSKIFLLPSGKILIGGSVGGSIVVGYISRYNSDGTQDTTFESPTFTDPEDKSLVNGFDVAADESLIISGKFTSINSVSRMDVARLLPAGNVDPNFSSPAIFNPIETYSGKIALLPNGQSIINTVNFSSVFPISTDNRFYRLNADGSVDNSFIPPPTLTFISNWTLDNSNRIVAFGTFSGASRYVRLNTDGSLDTTFNPTITRAGTLSVIGVQPDGKVLIGGDFDRINGTPRNRFARVHADGTLDTTFDAGSGFNSIPQVITVQPDGKILVGGGFTDYNGTPKARLLRLNSSGSLDASFNPSVDSTVYAINVMSDGKILIGGAFANVNGVSQSALAKLNADGSSVVSFNAGFGSAVIQTIFVQSDGKLLVGGGFSGLNGFNRQNLVRLNSDSSLDTTFNAGSISAVKQAIQQSDGKYLALNSSGISRRNTDGSNDASFQTPTVSGTFNAMFQQTDGGIIVVGAFSQINSTARSNIARLSPNGALDILFLPSGANAAVQAIAKQSNEKIIVVGNFFSIGNVPRSGIAAITLSNLRGVTDFDYDGDGRADVSVFRPSENKWYIYRSSDGQIVQQIFAIAGDVAVPADFDGDGKTDVSIFRPASGDWWSLSSINGNQVFTHWGANGDIPRPSDFDGDGRADFIIFRPAENNWYRLGSLGGFSVVNFGLAGDKPVIGDFNGDGKSDVAIYRPSTGDWWWQSSADNIQRATHWGISSDIPAPADFDGDGKTDFAVYRASSGTWYILNSSNGSFTIQNFGLAEDKPVPADYDGDGRADIAVFRPSTGIWYLLRTTAGFTAQQFGVSTDVPTPNAFVP